MQATKKPLSSKSAAFLNPWPTSATWRGRRVCTWKWLRPLPLPVNCWQLVGCRHRKSDPKWQMTHASASPPVWWSACKRQTRQSSCKPPERNKVKESFKNTFFYLHDFINLKFYFLFCFFKSVVMLADTLGNGYLYGKQRRKNPSKIRYWNAILKLCTQ